MAGSRWTQEDDDFLEAWAGKRSLASIGQSLGGRSGAACAQRLQRLGISARSNCEYMTANEVAAAYGRSSDNICDLIKSGKLPAKRFQGKHRRWLIDPEVAAKSPYLKPHRRRGEANKNAKMTEQDVMRVRSLHQEGRSNRSLGFEFGVSRRAIQNIVQRKSWTHVKEWWEPRG